MNCYRLQQSNNIIMRHLIAFFIVIGSCALISKSVSALPTAEFQPNIVDEPEPAYVVIKEEVIPDVENTTQKIIRVNPLGLPPMRANPADSIADSELFEIKSLLPSNRNYTSPKRMRRPRPRNINEDHLQAEASDIIPIVRIRPGEKSQKPRHQPLHKKKKLHFLYNQETSNGQTINKSLRVHIAPGSYPVYYAVSKTNGRFGKYPIKGFNNERDFKKYLYKSKLEPIELADRQKS